MWPFDIELPNDTAICSQCGNTYSIHGWHTCWPIDKAVKEAIEARDKDWIAWGEQECKNHAHFCKGILQRECLMCWRERKKEINP
jgi:hypothetical protein